MSGVSSQVTCSELIFKISILIDFQGRAKSFLPRSFDPVCSLRSSGNSLAGPKWKTWVWRWLDFCHRGAPTLWNNRHFEATCLRSSGKQNRHHKSPPKAELYYHASFLESRLDWWIFSPSCRPFAAVTGCFSAIVHTSVVIFIGL